MTHQAQFAYTIIHVQNVERTVQFYAKVFGLQKRPGISDEYVELETGTTLLVFTDGESERESVPELKAASASGGFHIAFTVPDVIEYYERALENGATSLIAPHQQPWGQHECWVRDPDGIYVSIVSTPAGT